MATIQAEELRGPHDGHVKEWKWAGLAAGDVGSWVTLPIKADKSVHLLGTFGGTVTIEGTLEPDTPTSAIALNDSRGEGNPLTFTAPDIRTVLDNVMQIRPNAGAGVASVTVLLLAVRP